MIQDQEPEEKPKVEDFYFMRDKETRQFFIVDKKFWMQNECIDDSSFGHLLDVFFLKDLLNPKKVLMTIMKQVCQKANVSKKVMKYY